MDVHITRAENDEKETLCAALANELGHAVFRRPYAQRMILDRTPAVAECLERKGVSS